ncbi:hypothetical protein [Niallia endozanthoxylica]|uniref:Uncharacterized protein n=1 Tax=Niallia endozanthoxylica TaxID=2036016 RepID=A0A5J5H1A8_9BACI|nr:hypothetical protein [Niallia endozanthoxylica]KAA9013462.1 hypothetical protein F4V44_24785 [Niallia endozanthoxylica]
MTEPPITFDDFFNVLINGVPISGFPATVFTSTFVPPSPDDVCFGSVTPTQTATVDLTPFAGQFITITFQVADVGDCNFDSAAFIDNLVVEGCIPAELLCGTCNNTVDFCQSIIVPPNFSVNTASGTAGIDTDCLQCTLEPCLVNVEIPNPCGDNFRCNVEVNAVRAIGCIPFYISVTATHSTNGSFATFCGKGVTCVDNIICFTCLDADNPCVDGFFDDAFVVPGSIIVTPECVDSCGNQIFTVTGSIQLPSC